MGYYLSKKTIPYSPTCLRLYHYAGNNPVRYVDPMGLYMIDNENGIVYCDLNNKEDMKLAQKEFSRNEKINSCIATISNSKTRIKFNNPESMKTVMIKNNFKIMLDTCEQYISSASTICTIGEWLAREFEFVESANLLEKEASFSGYIVTAIDIRKAATNPNFDTVSDVVIDVIGLMGPEGAAVSIYLSVSKKTSKNLAELFVTFGYEYEKQILNNWSRSLVGVDIKR